MSMGVKQCAVIDFLTAGKMNASDICHHLKPTNGGETVD